MDQRMEAIAMEYTAERVKRVSDADGASCTDCGQVFGRFWDLNMPWGWRKSQYMHESNGHKMELFKVLEVKS